MTDNYSDEFYVCSECVGSASYARWIKDHGRPGTCDASPEHGSQESVVEITELAKEVDRWFRSQYTQGEQYSYSTEDSDNLSYDQRGEPYKDIIRDELECDDDLVERLSEYLPDASNHDIAQGGEAFYDDLENYEQIADVEQRLHAEQADHWADYWYENRFRSQWHEFCQKVQYERRFFQLKELLDDLFGDPKAYADGAVRPIYELGIGEKIYRARMVDAPLTEDILAKDPAKELGAPPRDQAHSGRMNVEFIPAFYAAFSEDTALAEIRPGVDQEVAIGAFELHAALRVFDFTAFKRVDPALWKEVRSHTRFDFIEQLEDEISKSIVPSDRPLEYIPTQIVAEYIKEYLECDAVIYRSSMISNLKKESRNIVLLNKGEPFHGTLTSALRFCGYTIKRVVEVTYKFADPIPF